MKSCFGTFEQSVAGVRDDQSSKDDDSNALLLPAKKKSKMKVTSQSKLKGTPCLTKNQKRKLKQLQDEKEKRSLQSKSIKILERYKIQDDAYSLLCSSGSLGQVETMKEKRRRAVQFSRAGLEMPEDLPSFKKRRETASFQHEVTAKPDSDKSYLRQGCHGNDLLQPSASENVNLNNACVASASYLKPNCGSTLGKAFGSERSSTITESTEKNTVACMEDDQKISPIASSSYERGKDTKSLDVEGVPKIDRLNISVLADSSVEKPANDRTVVHVSRPKEVESKRGDLPIVMMEQEIMEAINEQPTVIICGETGCGKTTQVPQFLYEAGFGSSTCTNRRGIIGVTQPRRVAVLATAKRVAFELGLRLGKEVGFQVRHDKRIGNNCSIKFMTDGILLREVQSDFLLKRYSIIILDEAHERSLNTDILIGMLSRIMRVRQRLYVEQQEKVLSGVKISPENMITELKIVLMSATLRVEDFLSNRRLFREPPPIIEVQTRQFPVTVHFSKRTEIVDYMGQSYKKVMSIHKKLPPGGILVFVTGQREVEYLCRKLRKASRQLVENTYKGNTNDEVSAISEVDNAEHGPDMKDISEAFEIPSHSSDPLRFSSYNEDSDYIDRDSYTSDSGTDDDLGVDSDYEIHGSYEKTGMLVDVLREARSIASLKAAFEALSGKEPKANAKEKLGLSVAPDIEGCPKLSPSSGIKHGAYGLCPGALHVLPLYAMLPAAAQLRVFEGIPEGERLVVVATNVAETSLTIPGIKYVVDTGREKVKNYNCTNGMATYEVQWISKASAAQRAGRAGRTGPGHCYRLYSSAVFNNIFSDFSCAEITKTPVDGVFLLMKSMGIDKVANFPFPTPPETTALMEAECCLKALEALDSQGRLTPIGKAMAQYPMSPRHSCMLLTVIQIMGEQTVYARANLVLGYAIAAAAALSFSNPFIMQFDGGSRDDLDQGETCDAMGGHPKNNAKTEKILDQQERMRQKKLKAMAKMARAKFCNPTSDALTVAYALQLFELAESPFEFCKNHALHLKTMDEMSKLRKQLLQLIFHQSATVGSKQEFSWIHGNMEDVEHAWRILADKYPLALNEENLLGQAICAGWADRVAKRIRTVSELSDRDKKANAVRYQACFVNETVFLHRWSSVSQSAPEFLVYNELLHTKRPYMHGVTSVKSDWLIKYAGSLCSFSSPLTDPKPYYEPKTEQVLCWVSPTFGPHLWKLPLHSLPIKDDMLRVSVFACALLEGNVLPCLKSAQRFMAAPPSSILRPEASGQRRVGNLLNKFKVGLKTIDSRAKLRGAWKENPQELHWEIMQWFQEKFHNQFEELWAKMQHEVLLETRELFPKKMKRKERK